jgi:hypothetical protein
MLTRLLRILLWLASASTVAAFAVVIARRIGSPLAADPIEGAVLDFARRIAEHRPLYMEPLLSAPSPMMPGFPAVVSLLLPSLGADLWVPRAISLAAMLATAGLVFAIIRAETLSWTLAVAGVGLMFAGCGLIVGRPEVARPESLMLMLVVASFTTLRYAKRTWGAVLAAVLLSAACFTHVTALWFVAAMIFYVVTEEHQRMVVLLPALALPLAAGQILLSRSLGQWFNYYAWDLPFSSLRFEPIQLLYFTGNEMLGRLGVLVFAALISLALPTPPWRGVRGLWMCMGASALAAGLLASQNPRAGAELLLPDVVVLTLLGLISMHSVTRHLATRPGPSRGDGRGVVLAALILQFIVFFATLPPDRMNLRALTFEPAPASPPAVSAPSVSASSSTESAEAAH